MEDFLKRMEFELNKLKDEIKKPNILILGATGVGKSSLINLCFGYDFAKVGVGRPVTTQINSYETDQVPIVLFDTMGYEIGTNPDKDYFNHVIDFAINQQKEPIEKHIHLVWYCIQASGHRITDLDLHVISTLHKNNIPTAVVFTKCDIVTEQELIDLKSLVKHESVFSVSINKLKNDDNLELTNLINWSVVNLPDGIKETFIRSQKINLDLKREKAKNIILQHISGSAFVGFSPIPFSDAPILLANQALMYSRILYIYDLDWINNKIATLLKGLGIGQLISQGARMLAANLIKLIPGAGQLIGGLISATVASAVTAALGYSISEICYNINKMLLNNETDKLKDYLEKLNIESLFTKYYDKN